MDRFVRRILIAMLLGIAVYGAFVLYTGVTTMRETLRSFAWQNFCVALALATINYVLRFGKWQYYLRRLGVEGIGIVDSFLVFLSGFVLTVTPGKVGEVFKSAVLFRTHGVPIARTAPIVVADRLTDALGIVVLILLGSTTFAGGLGWALAGALAVGLALVVIAWERPMLTAFLAIERRGGKLAGALPKLREAQSSLRVVAGPTAILFPTVLSVIAWGAEGLALYIILRGFSVDIPLARAVFFYSTATLAGALVPLPGGLGIVESMLREQLVHLSQVPEGPATASMILIRFATLWWAVLVGFAALAAIRLRYPEKLGDASRIAESVSKS